MTFSEWWANYRPADFIETDLHPARIGWEAARTEPRKPRTCYWQSHGPTMNEMRKRAELVAFALGVERWGMHVDRAAMWFWPPDHKKPLGEFVLMTQDELSDGHWVHADIHSGECTEALS